MHSRNPDMNIAHQADGVVRMQARPKLKVITVSSGKGGVGKTNVAVNLGASLAMAGHRTMLMDADLGLANIDVLLGLSPVSTLERVVHGEASIEDILLDGPQGMKIVPAASGVKCMASLDSNGLSALIQAFNELPEIPEYLIVDAAPGIAEGVMRFCQAAHHVLIVVCDEPASITDAYALVKVLSRDYGVRRFQVVANQADNPAIGRNLFDKLERVSERFLDVDLFYAGNVPTDHFLRRAVQRRQAVVEAFPVAPASTAFKKLAAAADKWSWADGLRGQLEFFIERLARGGVAA